MTFKPRHTQRHTEVSKERIRKAAVESWKDPTKRRNRIEGMYGAVSIPAPDGKKRRRVKGEWVAV